MNIIFYKIGQNDINNSEIIQYIEREKCNDPGFDINLGDYVDNLSLLMYAVWKGREELVEYLLSDSNINVNHRNYDGDTVLHYCDDDSILKLLLICRDIDVNIQNKLEETGLHFTCYWARKAWVKEYLLDTRVDVLIRDNQGRTARDIAALGNKFFDIAKIINNSQYTTLLRIPNRVLLYDIVRMIIEEYL